LELDPTNDAAAQGLDSIVQRVVANAESAMYAGNVKQANAYLAQAKAINPNAPGIAALEQTQRQLRERQENQQVKEKLLAAANALQADKLMPPAVPNAYSLYQEVLTLEPNSEAARRGLDLVRAGLLDRARTMLAANNMSQTFALLDAAERAGASASAISELRRQAEYRQRLL